MGIVENERILLTGAGFTKNFGGPLAREISSLIFNDPRVQETPSLRHLVMNDDDYESIYDRVLNGSFSQDEKDTLHQVVKDIYEDIDRTIRDCGVGAGTSRSIGRRLRDLFRIAFDRHGKGGYVFTLNQDLFLERQYWDSKRPLLLGIEQSSAWFSGHFTGPLGNSDYVHLPTAEELERIKARYPSQGGSCYVKLHGSWNWIGPGQEHWMVLGRGKEEQIASEPLLQWYFEIFQQTLQQPGRHLFVIGYTFGDPHVNHVIAGAIRGVGLRVHVLNPKDRCTFQDQLRKTPEGDVILEGLTGYYPNTLADVFPQDRDSNPTQIWLSIMRQVFG